jgi:sulfur-carrier protein
MKLVYFAWVRERIGTPEEERDLPDSVHNVADLIEWLIGKGENYAYAFENAQAIRVAIDKKHVPHDAPLGQAREIAFFPPMTGG